MGYTLKIGDGRIECGDNYLRIDCDINRSDEAPAFGEPTDYESQRWPSYSAWAETMRALDLCDVMFNVRNGGVGEFSHNGECYSPLLQEHPGASLITQAHADIIRQKLNEYKKKHPTHIAKFPPPKPGAVPIAGDIYRESDYDSDPKYDCHLCRGEWLLWWCDWAVKNCGVPVFVNS